MTYPIGRLLDPESKDWHCSDLIRDILRYRDYFTTNTHYYGPCNLYFHSELFESGILQDIYRIAPPSESAAKLAKALGKTGDEQIPMSKRRTIKSRLMQIEGIQRVLRVSPRCVFWDVITSPLEFALLPTADCQYEAACSY